MRYCKKCVMPDTRPRSIFDERGICQACINYEKRKETNWEQRFNELKKACEKYKRDDGHYDSIIAVSGGKDSHFLTYVMKEKMGMNPLLVTVGDPFTKTEAGRSNLYNLRETFDCDLVSFDMSVELFRKVTRIAFEEFGEPLRFIEAAIYTIPIKFAINMDVPLIVYGENPAYEYGVVSEETPSGLKYINSVFKNVNIDYWLNRGVLKKELNAIMPPSENDFRRVKPNPIFMSYHIPWEGHRNYLIASRYGFKDLTHEWKREGNIEDFDQIDSVAYIVHLWLKYPKFGFARATDIASRWVRNGRITREEAIKLVMEHDHNLDQRAMEDFIRFMKYTRREFWDRVEKFWNGAIFEKVDGAWRLKDPIYKNLIRGTSQNLNYI